MADKIQLDGTKLIEVLAFLDLVPQRAGIPSSDYLRAIFRKNVISISLASEVSGFAAIPFTSGEWATPGEEIYFDRRLLFPFVMSGKGNQKPITLSRGQNNLVFTQGQRSATFSDSQPVGGYAQKSDVSKVGDELKFSPDLRDLMAAATSCSTNDSSVPQLNCVLIRNGRVYASNRTTVLRANCRGQKIDKAFDYPFPVATAALLGNPSIDKIVATENQITLCSSQVPGQLQETASAFAKKDFPSETIDKTLASYKDSTPVLILPAEALAASLDGLVGYMAGVRRQDWILKLQPHPKGVMCLCEIAQQGVFQELIPTPVQAFQPIEWPLDMVLAIIKYAAKLTKEFYVYTDEVKKTPYLLTDEGYTSLLVARKV